MICKLIFKYGLLTKVGSNVVQMLIVKEEEKAFSAFLSWTKKGSWTKIFF